MRVRVGFAVGSKLLLAMCICIAALASCTLLVSTDDLEGVGAATAPDGSKPDGVASGDGNEIGDGSSGNDVVVTNDAGVDANRDPHLIGQWLFDDGTATDSSGNNHHASLVSGAVIAPSLHGGAVQLHDLPSEAIEVQALGLTEFPEVGTLSLWFRYTTAIPVSQFVGFFDNFDSSRSHIFLRHANGAPSDQIQFAVQPTSSSYLYVDNFNLAIATWVHVALRWDSPGRTASIFVNGVLHDIGNWQADAAPAPFTPKDQAFIFGRRLIGEIDEIRLYDVVLDENAIFALFKLW